MQDQIFFNGWDGIVRILVIAPAAYVVLVLFLRISGKRTLTKLNAFDLVVTVALGSTLATQILSKQTPLLEGVLAMALLILLQWLVTFVSVRSPSFRKLVRSSPAVLLRDGRIETDTLRNERITEKEVLQAVRASGGRELADADLVFLQSDGSLAAVMR
jgi:uncharacterized membrane protein YcaP (DUF421 family)